MLGLNVCWVLFCLSCCVNAEWECQTLFLCLQSLAIYGLSPPPWAYSRVLNTFAIHHRRPGRRIQLSLPQSENTLIYTAMHVVSGHLHAWRTFQAVHACQETWPSCISDDNNNLIEMTNYLNSITIFEFRLSLILISAFLIQFIWVFICLLRHIWI